MLIYVITNLVNGKKYVGQTVQTLEERFREHTFPSSGCIAIRDAIAKYGQDNFKIEELAKASSIDELNALEAHYVQELNTLAPSGYNLKDGGLQGVGFTPEVLEKMRNAKLGTVVPEDVKDRMSLSHKRRFQEHPELREQRSQASKKMWQDPEYCQQMQQIHKLYWSDADNRAAAAERAQGVVDDVWKKKISDAVTSKLATPEVRAKIGACARGRQKAVIRSDGVRFASIQKAAQVSNVSSSSIIKTIQGRYKTSGGFGWQYESNSPVKPVLYLVCGVSGSGKTWVCSQLTQKFAYLSSDTSGRDGHIAKLLEMSKEGRPLLYDLSVGISTFIKRHSDLFEIFPVFIVETKEVVLERLKLRGTGDRLSEARLVAIDKRTAKYGVFSGTAGEVLEYLRGVSSEARDDQPPTQSSEPGPSGQC